MKFELNGVTIELDSRAVYPYPSDTMFSQAKELSASGIVHVEDFKVRASTFTYNFEDMSDSDYIKIFEFFVNDAVGMLNEFNLTDDLNVTRTVRFTERRLGIVKKHLNLNSGSFTVEEVN